MAPDSLADDPSGQQEQQDRLRGLLRTATAQLLGATIAVPDTDWRAPSRLPGWSRGHVASHVARHADALVRLSGWARTGRREGMYASHQRREDEITEGAGRSGLELQVDLDGTAGGLERAFDQVAADAAWGAVVELRGGLQVPARLLPLARLLEVTLHHVDLDLGYELGDVDAVTADWLLEWCAFRLRERDEFPRLTLVSGTTRLAVGASGPGRTVGGSSADLLGWLTGRIDDGRLQGADGLRLPAF